MQVKPSCGLGHVPRPRSPCVETPGRPRQREEVMDDRAATCARHSGGKRAGNGAGRGHAQSPVQPPPRGSEGAAFPLPPPLTAPRALPYRRAGAATPSCPRPPGGRPGRWQGHGPAGARRDRQLRRAPQLCHHRPLAITATFIVVISSDVPVPGHDDGGGGLARPPAVALARPA